MAGLLGATAGAWLSSANRMQRSLLLCNPVAGLGRPVAWEQTVEALDLTQPEVTLSCSFYGRTE